VGHAAIEWRSATAYAGQMTSAAAEKRGSSDHHLYVA